MNRDERFAQLSRFLAGELPESEADAMRRRLEEDSQLAEAAQQMRGLGDRVAELPDQAPPPQLDRAALAVMRAAAEPEAAATSPRWRFDGVAGWLPVWMRPRLRNLALPVAACALAAAVVLAWPRPDAQPIILLEGSQLVDGHVMVLAGPVPVEVDGLALITVEPSGVTPREMGQEVNMRGRDILAGALAGVAISVVVYEGKAVFQPEDEEPITVTEGNSTTWTAPSKRAGGPAAGAQPRTAPRRPTAYRPPPPPILDDEVDEAPADEEADDPAAEIEDTEDWEDPDGIGEEEAERYPTSKEGINDAIREELSEIRECYQSWLNMEPDLEGEVKVKFVISDVEGVGEVTSTEIMDQTTTSHTLFEGCVLNVMSDLKFEAPEDGGVVIVSYPFVFKSTDADVDE